MPNPDFTNEKSKNDSLGVFENIVVVIIILSNIAFLVFGIFSKKFRESLLDNDNSASCRYEQDCDM